MAQDSPRSRDDQVRDAILEYFDAAERGQPLDRKQFLLRHAEIETELRAFFDDEALFRNRLRGVDELTIVAPPVAPPRIPSIGGDELSPEATVIQDSSVVPDLQGTVIAGRYELLEKIGEGGMGEVWVARQSAPVKRKVALKLIKPGMDSRDVIRRFEQERQALALMDHPHIAKVLDGGLTSEFRPFFVMELVNGLPLTRYCDDHRLGIPERLQLFTSICLAVQHAHQKGIVHRDLKPSNILVAIVDGRPVAKVIDFGVAKATGGKLTDHTLSTCFGVMIGTFEYMAPEQTGFSGVDVDTRADIYSMGVILYELLTGLKPFDSRQLENVTVVELVRMIREEEPVKPSTRISMNAGLTILAAFRQIEPSSLRKILRGDLDWVVMKCLEKQRDRRYSTANALLRDIQSYLADEPVEARPPSRVYLLRKVLRRNRGFAGAAGLVFLVLIVGMIGTTLGLLEARRQAVRANRDRQRAERETRIAQAERLAALSQSLRIDSPSRSLCLAVESGLATRHADEGWLSGSRLALLDSLRSAQPRRILAGHSLKIVSSIFSPDNHWAVTGSMDDSARIWNLHDRNPLASSIVLDGHYGTVTDLDISSDSHWLATRCASSVVWLWDLTAADPRASLHRLSGHADEPVTCTGFSPDANLFLTGGSDFTICVWDFRQPEFWQGPRRLQGHTGAIACLAFSGDSRRAATGSWDATARVWDLSDGKSQGTELVLSGHTQCVSCVTFSLDGRWLVTGSLDGSARVWDLSGTVADSASRVLTGSGPPLEAVAVSPRGRRVATRDSLGSVRIWDLSDRESVDLPLDVSSGDTPGFVITHEGPFRVRTQVVDRSTVTRIWNLTEDYDVVTLDFPGSPVGASRPARWVTTLGENGDLQVWDLQANHPCVGFRGVSTRHGGVYVTGRTDNEHLPISADGRFLLLESKMLDNSLQVLTLSADALSDNPRIIPAASGSLVVKSDLGADNRWLSTRDESGDIELWDLQSDLPGIKIGRPVIEQEPAPWWARRVPEIVRFTPGHLIGSVDGAFLSRELGSVGSAGQTLRLEWDTRNTTATAISPDGRFLVTGGIDGELRIWNRTGPSDSSAPSVIRGHAREITCAEISPDSTYLVTASLDGAVHLWNLVKNRLEQPLRVFGGHDFTLDRLVISPDNRFVVGLARQEANPQKTPTLLCYWDLFNMQGDQKPKCVAGPLQPWSLVEISSDTSWVAAAVDDGTVWIWDLETEAVPVAVNFVPRHQGHVSRFVFDAESRWLLAGAVESDVPGEGQTFYCGLPPRPATVFATGVQGELLGLSPDGKRIVTRGPDRAVRVWQWQWPDLVELAKHSGRNLTREEWATYFPNTNYRKTFPDLPVPGTP